MKRPELSPDIAADERIVRAVKTPTHLNLKNGKLKGAAYRPQVGQTALSCMRQIIGADDCKNRAVELCLEGKGAYSGLSVITAKAVRAEGSEVIDWPEDYYGHAHIVHPFPAPVADDPASAKLNATATLHYQKLADAAKYYEDPQPLTNGWHGSSLE